MVTTPRFFPGEVSSRLDDLENVVVDHAKDRRSDTLASYDLAHSWTCRHCMGRS
jgi:hypothetical protein